ncbi:ATPase [Carboxylicivirga sp. M1479]|uniref:ATPase n=1 Tax=Carboxylicivirga sp. M1479 TaxID=2594476 RepID=UPI001177FD08|nr:ATPase [Carboxylicivirga sp. M1479]TRX64285.1 ATPase [Carboxylicivirga sp. M1479]
MILIADSGSTKTEWRLINPSNNNSQVCITDGINPFFQSSEDIYQSLENKYTLLKTEIQALHFYGAGCANEEKNNVVKTALSQFFNAESITINSDLLGAARSLFGNKAGIACILGTGSNSCYYNGTDIIDNVSPLGFIIGDEGSGAVLGKKLMGDILKNQLPQEVIRLFYANYQTDRAEILDKIYKQPFPNRYLAQYTKFISANIHIDELEQIVINSFKEFIQRNLLQYPNAAEMKIGFIGSIAHYFEPQLHKALYDYQLLPGTIRQTPMDGLVAFHMNS